jgi:hypothetical protein
VIQPNPLKSLGEHKPFNAIGGCQIIYNFTRRVVNVQHFLTKLQHSYKLRQARVRPLEERIHLLWADKSAPTLGNYFTYLCKLFHAHSLVGGLGITPPLLIGSLLRFFVFTI